MKVTKTLGWVQSHPQHAEVRVNIQTTALNDDGSVAMRSGEDVVLTDASILAAAQTLERLVAAATHSELPAVEVREEDPTRTEDELVEADA
jgi:hypothetical protein